MTNYYWIIAQHSGKVLEVKGGYSCSSVEIIQHTKKSELDPNVDMQLWYFNGGFITNKRSGFVLDVQGWRFENGTKIHQYQRFQEPSRGREWEYDYEDNTISLKFNRKFVLDVAGGSNDNGALIILHEKHGGKNQQFILQKWDDGSAVIENAVTNITENFKFLPRLSENFLEILNDDEYYDVNIEVGNDSYVKTFHAHKVVLSYRSPYLRRKLSTNKKNRDGTLARIELSNILPEIFEIILRYIYGGRLSLKESDTSDIIKLLVAANELSLQELTSFEDNSFLDLQKYCNDLISNEPDKIFESQNFTSIPEKLLISVIQNDNLQMSEIQVWEYVLKWGIAQNREIPSSPKDYSKEDFKTLKNTLKQCIPFIRFCNLNSKEFAYKVSPYKKILPKELYENLILSHLDPDKKGESKPRILRNIGSKDIDSNIITSQHAEIISKWVNKLEITDKLTSPHEFKLLFRGSRDGFYSNKFHEIYRDESHILSRIVDNRHAIDNRSYYGPSFGNGDLIIWGLDTNTLCNACKNSYERSITKTKDRFSIEEYEVFRLMNTYQ
ncbi:carbohydrate-binding module family 13 protein [Rhizophagus clarus]|uniref:Carbohydrate-binding module family 13 protein n=2 Tax=Rhizophagus clarus TaxID=94130 RepID=A0A8H3MF90_9GLOM|nr:carbohydrate-binding module family 13 protein [Rhizophagus clarus]